MAIPAELPREEHPQVEDSAASPNDAGAADPGNEASPEAFDFGELAPWEMLERRRGSAREEQPIFEPLSREERERRRQIRSLAWMIGGAVLLVIAAAVLSRL